MKHRFKISLDIFPYDIIVLMGKDIKGHKKYLKRYIGKDAIEGFFSTDSEGYTQMFDNNGIVMHLKSVPKMKNPKSIGILAHEATHAVTFILNTMGVTFSDDSDEVYAYFIDYVVTMVLMRCK